MIERNGKMVLYCLLISKTVKGVSLTPYFFPGRDGIIEKIPHGEDEYREFLQGT